MKDSISKKQLYEFGLLIGFGFPILIGWLLPAFAGHGFRVWTLWVGVPLLILGVLKPRLLFFPYKAWMKLGLALGWINSRIILGIIFVVILQPIAFIMLIFGYDPLKKKKTKQKAKQNAKKKARKKQRKKQSKTQKQKA